MRFSSGSLTFSMAKPPVEIPIRPISSSNVVSIPGVSFNGNAKNENPLCPLDESVRASVR